MKIVNTVPVSIACGRPALSCDWLTGKTDSKFTVIRALLKDQNGKLRFCVLKIELILGCEFIVVNEV